MGALRLLLVPILLSASARDKPHIVLILVDDLGSGDLGCQGAADVRTAAIDAVFQAGLRFTRFYANSTVCSPTRAALLTGRYPDLVGVPGVIRTGRDSNWGHLAPGAVLLPALLKKAGYHTAIVGKWHLGLEAPNLPTLRGFDHFHGFLGDMMDDYYTHRRDGRNFMRKDGETIETSGHATDLFTAWAIEYLNSRKGRPEPFFLYLAYNAPHSPVQPPPDFVERVKKREAGIAEKRARLVALIEHLDAGIGRVVDALRANGQLENTLLVFTSDNGGQLDLGASNGALRGGKQDLYEGGLRVATAAAWPGRILPGRTEDRVALSMDLFPTLCEAAGAPVEGAIEGRSLLGLFLGREEGAPERDLVFMRREGGPRYNGQDYYAVRRGDWKLVQNHPFEPFQLYSLKEDPREEKDVLNENRAVAQDLMKVLRAHVQKAGAVPWQKP